MLVRLPKFVLLGHAVRPHEMRELLHGDRLGSTLERERIQERRISVFDVGQGEQDTTDFVASVPPCSARNKIASQPLSEDLAAKEYGNKPLAQVLQQTQVLESLSTGIVRVSVTYLHDLNVDSLSTFALAHHLAPNSSPRDDTDPEAKTTPWYVRFRRPRLEVVEEGPLTKFGTPAGVER